MELKILNDQGQAAGTVAAGDTSSAVISTSRWCTRSLSLIRPMPAGHPGPEGPQEVRHSTQKPWRQKGTGRARAGMTSSPMWRGGGRIFPNSPDENFSHKVNKKMYRAGMCSILSQLAREDRLAVVDSLAVDAPKTKLLADALRAMGLHASMLILTDTLDENLLLASRNLPERDGPGAALCGSAVAGSLRKGPDDPDRAARSRRCWDEDHIALPPPIASMQVLLGPVVSEKSTMIGEKHNQSRFV